MPRERNTTATADETVIKKPRTTRSRAVSSDDSSAPRKRRTITPVHVPPTDVSHHTVERKAPTALSDQHRRKIRNSRGLIIVSSLCIIISGISIGVGVFDRGVIDVVAVVNERNEKINRGEVRDAAGQTITQTVNVQAPDTRPNGGLILADVQPSTTPAVPPPVVTDATSTATSTDSVTDEATTTTTTTEEVAP